MRKTTVLLFSVAIPLLVPTLAALCWFGFGICDTNTLESSAFSEKAFDSVRAGMTRDDVLKIVGPPLEEDCKRPLSEEWRYGVARQPRGPDESGAKWIYFDVEGRVFETLGDPKKGRDLVAGSVKADVIRSLGNPLQILPRRPCSMAFTAAKEAGNDTRRVRQLTFDEKGTVVDIVSYRMRD